MGFCNIKYFTRDMSVEMSCDYFGKKIDSMKGEFSKMNGVYLSLVKDKMYSRFCDEFDGFLENYKSVYKKCTPDQHEGMFCRCEDRNTYLAQKMRDAGMFQWC